MQIIWQTQKLNPCHASNCSAHVQPLGQLTKREENCSNTFEAQSSNNHLIKNLTNTDLMTRKKLKITDTRHY